MKPTDLRLGNLLVNGRGEIGYVDRLDIDGDIFTIHDNRFIGYIEPVIQGPDIEHLQPITLNDWWASRLKTHAVMTLGEWIKEHNDSFKMEVVFARLRFVHEYQNLYFALTGEELTVNTAPDKKKIEKNFVVLPAGQIIPREDHNIIFYQEAIEDIFINAKPEWKEKFGLYLNIESDERFDKDVPVGSLMAENGPCSYEYKIDYTE